ncbi:MAG: Flp family type IVb pilin [Salinarimonas sp.]
MPPLQSIGTPSAFLRDERGATAIEYALIAAVMAVIMLATLSLLEDPLNVAFQFVADSLQDSADEMTLIQ